MREFTEQDYRTAYRYLGILQPTQSDFERAFSVIKELKECANPKHIIKVCDVVFSAGIFSVAELNLTLSGESAKKAFANSQKIAVTASTLGAGVDKKIMYYSAVDMLKATILDALASVMIDNELDDMVEELKNKYPQYSFSNRFSCGYGDLPLSLQPEIIRALNATKLIGVSVNSANLMVPGKTITSFIGIADCA